MDELSKRYFGLIMDKVKTENAYEKYLKQIIKDNDREKYETINTKRN